MTQALRHLINDLQGNMEVIGLFLERPNDVIEKYGIEGIEKELLLTRNIEGLTQVGLTKKSAYVAMSDAHKFKNLADLRESILDEYNCIK